MKTWSDFIPALWVSAMVPIVLVLIPTVNLGGHYVGGGPFRQWIANNLFALLNNRSAAKLIYQFESGGYLNEILITLPAALNASVILLIITFLFSQRTIQSGAKQAAKNQDQKTKLAKEA